MNDLLILIAASVGSAVIGVIAKAYTDQSAVNMDQTRTIASLSDKIANAQAHIRMLNENTSDVIEYLEKTTNFRARRSRNRK